jgi:hypothetical protein
LRSPVDVAEDHPRHAVDDALLKEVDQHSQRHIEQLHVAQQLRFVDVVPVPDALDLDEQAVFDEQVEPQLLLSHSRTGDEVDLRRGFSFFTFAE